MEPRAEINKLGWVTDGGGSGIKFVNFILTWNHGLSRKTNNVVVYNGNVRSSITPSSKESGHE